MCSLLRSWLLCGVWSVEVLVVVWSVMCVEVSVVWHVVCGRSLVWHVVCGRSRWCGMLSVGGPLTCELHSLFCVPAVSDPCCLWWGGCSCFGA